MKNFIRYVVTYDIRKDSVRNKLFRLLEGYGAWKQFSVFEMNITDVQFVHLDATIRDLIEPTDRVRIYQLCDHCIKNIKMIGDQSGEKMSNVI
jgi:CRISPR-associated protein Cas2